jgi:hypothetical protein
MMLSLVAVVLSVFSLAPVPPALAFTNSNFVQFTLEGCRNPVNFTLPICQDTEYTSGNLGKTWNELDLVPYRLTTKAGTQANATTDYNVIIAADNQTSGRTGYDVITAPVLNAAKSHSSCTVTAGSQSTTGSVTGGADVVMYLTLTIHQDKGTTCVFDYLQRLALGAHLYPGSSLQSYMFEREDFSTGKKTISIPVNEIEPQALNKDMTASQAQDFTWEITKDQTPAVLDFGNTCAPEADLTKEVQLTVTWTRSAAIDGQITVTTHVYATNPAHRAITACVTDVIRSGTTALDTAGPSCTSVPANTTLLVLTHSVTVAAGTTNLNDIATATYTDDVTQIPVPGQTTATASANVQVGEQTNETATITDAETITAGVGLDFILNSINPSDATWTCDTGLPSPPTTGIYTCTSNTQSGNGSAVFNKTVQLDQPRKTSGLLVDRAVLTGADGFTAKASAQITVQSDATVELTIEKKIPPDILENSDTVTFNFQVRGPSPATTLVASPSIAFVAGETAKSVTVSGLDPGTYEVTELATTGFTPTSNPQNVTINLPTCAGQVTFDNILTVGGGAKVQVKKVTDPTGNEAGWTFHLNSQNPGVTTVGSGFEDLGTDLDEGSYTVTEDLQSGWEYVSAACTRAGIPFAGTTFTVNYPDDFGVTYQCTFTNKSRGEAEVVKTVQGAAPSGSQAYTFQLRQGASTTSDGTLLETLIANAGNLGVITFTNPNPPSGGPGLIPGLTYQLCEEVFPGWNTNLSNPPNPLFVPNSIMPPSLPNPNVNNLPVCVDFSVGFGATKTFTVDNTPPPGGRALTIGFWKNWASCAKSSGKQKPVLDQTLASFPGGGVYIGKLFVDTCQEAVRILSKQDVSSGANKGSDPAFNLTAQLLAAKLNVQAGAGVNGCAVNAINSAQDILDGPPPTYAVSFNGTGSYPKSGQFATNANSLATTLDKYNNTNSCP